MSKEYRTIPANEVLARFSVEEQAKIHARALQLIAEEMGLSDLRRVRHLTQEDVAETLGTKQSHVSRFEKRDDVKVSNLREYVVAIGGDLSLLVTLPDGSPYRLAFPPLDEPRQCVARDKDVVAKPQKASKQAERERLRAKLADMARQAEHMLNEMRRLGVHSIPPSREDRHSLAQRVAECLTPNVVNKSKDKKARHKLSKNSRGERAQ